jgi:hypothetical protein
MSCKELLRVDGGISATVSLAASANADLLLRGRLTRKSQEVVLRQRPK